MNANPQPAIAFGAPDGPVHPRLNALKHGLRSEAILLPGEDADEFRRRRRVLFQTYLPQTEDEAECVESMAEMRWRLQRCRHVQAVFDAHVMALATDAAGRVCEPDGHQRLHSSMDCTVHQQRIDRMLCRARARLVELQKLRRLGLVAGAAALPRGCYVDGSGEVIALAARPAAVGPAAAPAPAPRKATANAGHAGASTRGSGVADARAASGSNHGEKRISSERSASVGTQHPAVIPSGAGSERPRGRLIGGFGARRLFADTAAPTPPLAPSFPQHPGQPRPPLDDERARDAVLWAALNPPAGVHLSG